MMPYDIIGWERVLKGVTDLTKRDQHMSTVLL